MESVGRYIILRVIAQGGMSTVYQAYDPLLERHVAIKLVLPGAAQDTKFRKRFERELQTVTQLTHSGIVEIYDYGEQGGQPYLVMAYMPGGTLAERIKLARLSLPAVLTMLSQLAPALDLAHEKSIIHRDIKPGNILFDGKNIAHLADFGLVKTLKENNDSTAGISIGTPAYMSPEQVVGSAIITSQSDIYSLGATIFEALTGKQPYIDPSPLKVVMMHLREPIPNILEMRPELPPHIQPVIEMAMAKKPNMRISSATLLLRALREPVMARMLESQLLPQEDL